jgi:hypothetical protein
MLSRLPVTSFTLPEELETMEEVEQAERLWLRKVAQVEKLKGASRAYKMAYRERLLLVQARKIILKRKEV